VVILINRGPDDRAVRMQPWPGIWSWQRQARLAARATNEPAAALRLESAVEAWPIPNWPDPTPSRQLGTRQCAALEHRLTSCRATGRRAGCDPNAGFDPLNLGA